MELKIKAVSPKIGREFPLPQYKTAGAAAMDLCACMEEDVTLAPGQRLGIPTGIAIALPSPDYVALVFVRSGMGFKHGIGLSNGVGVIDSDYRGGDLRGADESVRGGLYHPARGPHRPADGGAGGAACSGAGGGAG